MTRTLLFVISSWGGKAPLKVKTLQVSWVEGKALGPLEGGEAVRKTGVGVEQEEGLRVELWGTGWLPHMRPP